MGKHSKKPLQFCTSILRRNFAMAQLDVIWSLAQEHAASKGLDLAHIMEDDFQRGAGHNIVDKEQWNDEIGLACM